MIKIDFIASQDILSQEEGVEYTFKNEDGKYCCNFLLNKMKII